MLGKLKEKLGKLKELEALQQENQELQENVNDLVGLNVIIKHERDALREKIDNLRKEQAALKEQIRLMQLRLAPKRAVKSRFDELKINFDWD